LAPLSERRMLWNFCLTTPRSLRIE
jgi:hypothetical protein